jgi:Tol biopolymer transport system component
MKNLIPAIVILMSTLSVSQTLSAPQAITDPKQISSKSNAAVEKNLSIEKLYMTRVIGGTTWSPDGKQIAFITNITGRNNLWIVPAEGGWPVQLTISDQRQAAPAWSPDGKWIAYMSDYDGDEQWDIFLVSPKTGQVVNLTNTREIAEEIPTWSPDGRYLAYNVKPKTSSVFEIDIYDTVQREVKHLTSGTPKDKMNTDPIWSPDGKSIVYTQQQAKGTDSNIFIADIATGKSALLTPHDGERIYSANDLSPDGKSVLITSNAGNGYDNVGLLDVASKQIKWLTNDKWEIAGGGFSPDGKQLTWVANVDGNTDVYIHEVASGKSSALPLPKGVNGLGGNHSAFTRDGARLLYYHNGPNAPNDAWAYTMADGKSQQITRSAVGGIRAADMVEPSLVHYPSKDGKWTISAFVYMPYNLPKNAQHPAYRLRSWRSDVADRKLLQPVRAIRRKPGIHRDRTELSRFDRIRQGISECEPVRHGRRRSAGRVVGSGMDQADRLCRSEEADCNGRKLRRIHVDDGRYQGPGGLGCGCADRSVRELLHRNRKRRSSVA